MLKAFGYIERVVKSDFFRIRPILHHSCATCPELPSYISTMKLPFLIPEMAALFFLEEADQVKLTSPELEAGGTEVNPTIKPWFLYFMVTQK